ncbi:triose-phosphate isomerase [Bdellovibrio sp. SKB1291214]|uniref:triose-phosphate isomerase n=1 Tax=Bdellovibrio sp. SKB1291214 TaxID=1732569 RepID=UPI000B51B259|nr:triose-phosphate isomerase [Bdellovibrio sp. SKB1291214]UYL09752.1 triose-phosphate isomerase [Bdellovibrio sp. SKB1291214]
MKKIFAGNWKLFKTPAETRAFLGKFKEVMGSVTGEIVFFPPAISLEAASEAVKGSAIKFGVQNAYTQASGAFTGENSAAVVKEIGGTYILIGHSERRSIFGETDALIADKVAYVQSLGLTPMLCIGETLQEREATHTFRVLETQLLLGLAKADKSKPIVVAYEPVWAIGTGKVATPEQVAETHTDVYNILSKMGFTAPILYGGSVKPDNAAQLIKQAHVSGFLVGGASLEVDSFQKIASV